MRFELKYLVLLFLALASCAKSDEPSNCPSIIINSEISNDTTETYINIDTIKVVDHCLVLTLGYSGCDENHDIDVLTTGILAESSPPQLVMVIRDNTQQFCLAYFTKEYSYDLDKIDDIIKDDPSVWLKFKDKKFLYKK